MSRLTAAAASGNKRQQPSDPASEDVKEAAPVRSKKQGSKRSAKGGSRGNGPPPPVEEVPEGQSDFVRVMKVESRKADTSEDPTRVQLSKIGKAPQLLLSDDRLSVTGSKGYRSARASHGVHAGTWYCEVKMTHLGSTGHARVGWCTKKAELQAPVGFDQYGFAYRDLEGSKVHQGRREPYGEPFGENDVIGLLLHMPAGGKPLEAQDRNVVRFKGAFYYVDEPEPKPEPLIGSQVLFTKNGILQGVAFSDILEGTYYPAACLYTLPEQSEGATVTFNFGPDFQYPPPTVEGAGMARAMYELASSPLPVSALPSVEQAPQQAGQEAEQPAALQAGQQAVEPAAQQGEQQAPQQTEPQVSENAVQQLTDQSAPQQPMELEQS